MFVKDIMSDKLVMVKPGDTIQSVVKLMVFHNISGLVVQEDGKAVGIITTIDVLRKVVAEDRDSSETLVKDAMSSPVITVHPLNRVEKAAELMRKHHVTRLAVVDNLNRVAGIVTMKDIVSNIPEMIDVMFQTWVKPQWR